MKLSVKNSIYQAIIHGKWLDVSYVNRKKESTNYYIGIKDVDIDKGTIACDIFNPYKSNTVIQYRKKETYIYISGIESASILESKAFVTTYESHKKQLSCLKSICKKIDSDYSLQMT